MLGRINPAWLAFGGSVALLVVLVGLLYWLAGPAAPVVVYGAASMKAPLEAIAGAYEREYGQRVELHYGASQTILTNLELAGEADVFLPADESYVRLGQDKGLLTEVYPLARMRAVVLVQPGNPKKIGAFADLLAGDVNVGQANPDAAAIGKLTRDALVREGKWEALRQHTTAFMGTVTDVANAVELGTLDAGIVWDAVAFQHPRQATVRLPELDPVTARVELALCKASRHPADALRFARFVAAPDRGLAIFKENGFSNVEDAGANAHALQALPRKGRP